MSLVASNPTHTPQRKARAEAAAWVVRLHGPQRSAVLEAAFRDWLAVSPENQSEFERVSQVWEDARTVPVGGLTRLSQWRRPRLASRSAIAAGLTLLCATGGFTLYQLWFANHYRTGVGEQRIVRLEDGTRVSLNSGTRLEVSFTKRERHVTLKEGEAYFEVAHNPHRPFIVTAGLHDVTAVGTTFLVRYDEGSTAVTLVEGKVTVSNALVEATTASQGEGAAADLGEGKRAPANAGAARSLESDSSEPGLASGAAGEVVASPPGRAPSREGSADVVTLTPGERLRLPKHAAAILDEPHIDAVTAWRRGEVVLERTRLDDAVTEMNRYEDKKLVLSSPEIARLKISGIYHVGDGAGFAETVAKLYHLEVTRGNGEIRISGDHPAAAPAQP